MTDEETEYDYLPQVVSPSKESVRETFRKWNDAGSPLMVVPMIEPSRKVSPDRKGSVKTPPTGRRRHLNSVTPNKIRLPSVKKKYRSDNVVDLNDLQWNGTFIGSYKRNVIKIETRTERGKYWDVEINGFEISFQIDRVPNSDPFILDECKSFFGLNKLGTHKIQILKSKYRVLHIERQNHAFLQDFRLNEFEKESLSDDIIYEIAKIYTFRHIFGINTRDSDIHIKIVDDEIDKVVSYREGEIRSYNPKPISKVAMTKWFKKKSPQDILRETFKVNDEEDVLSALSKIRSYIEKIVNDIDSQRIHVVSHVIANIQKYIEY